MPRITFDLTDTQAGKLMAFNGWKVEDLSAIAKRVVVELTSSPAKVTTPRTASRNHEANGTTLTTMVGQVEGE